MIAATAQAFTEEQKQYLQGFFAGVMQRGGPPFVGETGGGLLTSDPAAAAVNLAAPDSGAQVSLPAQSSGAQASPPAREEQDVARTVSPRAIFGTPVEDLCKEERFKLERNGLDIWDTLLVNCAADKFPEGGDVFRYKFHGLFYVAPAQEALMCRLRIPACQLSSRQLRGIAQIAGEWGGGYADITTRGNIQIREIAPANAVNVLMKLYELGLTSRGAGADNIRNITATPTSGFDPQELFDVRPLAFGLHHYILNSRDLYGLPRKFNISFDSGGSVSVAADTNDIGFFAVRVGENRSVAPGVYFRVELGGITGHGDFTRDCGILIQPEQCVAVAAAMVRVFVENGDRTNRKQARLKYLLERWGGEKFVAETQRKLAFPLTFFPRENCEPRAPVARHAHLGVHPQAQPGMNYVGVAIPVGRMTVEQMQRLADLAETCGAGELRLTVFQNLLIPHVPDERLDALKQGLIDAGFHHRASSIAGGLVACTGNTGCKFSATNTKGQALALGRYLEEKLELDTPINIHLTGCPHSCAQHYCGDIGLLGVKTTRNGGSVEGYNVVLGGGMDHEQGLGREIFKGVPFDELPALLERVLQVYLELRRDGETFIAFTRRHEVAELRALFSEQLTVSSEQ